MKLPTLRHYSRSVQRACSVQCDRALPPQLFTERTPCAVRVVVRLFKVRRSLKAYSDALCRTIWPSSPRSSSPRLLHSFMSKSRIRWEDGDRENFADRLTSTTNFYWISALLFPRNNTGVQVKRHYPVGSQDAMHWQLTLISFATLKFHDHI